jgi:isoquinoline 1-oxidoreductase alpha subunit
MSGQIMTAAAFLDENPAPSSEEIVEAMGQNYCRCGCYTRIFTAVEKAAGETTAQQLSEHAT